MFCEPCAPGYTLHGYTGIGSAPGRPCELPTRHFFARFLFFVNYHDRKIIPASHAEIQNTYRSITSTQEVALSTWLYIGTKPLLRTIWGKKENNIRNIGVYHPFLFCVRSVWRSYIVATFHVDTKGRILWNIVKVIEIIKPSKEIQLLMMLFLIKTLLLRLWIILLVCSALN